MECSRKVFCFRVSSGDVIVHHNHVSCVMRDFWDEKSKLETSGRVFVDIYPEEEMSTPYDMYEFLLFFIIYRPTYLFCCGWYLCFVWMMREMKWDKKAIGKVFWMGSFCMYLFFFVYTSRIENEKRTRYQRIELEMSWYIYNNLVWYIDDKLIFILTLHNAFFLFFLPSKQKCILLRYIETMHTSRRERNSCGNRNSFPFFTKRSQKET